MTRRRLVLLVPALLTLHNIEEALTFWHALPVIRAGVPVAVDSWLSGLSASRVYGGLLMATIVPWLVALWSARRGSSLAATWTVLLVQAVVFVNVFWHVLVAGIVLRGYAPGLLTAILINLPFSIYLFGRARRERWCSPRALALLLPAALLVHGPALAVVMLFS